MKKIKYLLSLSVFLSLSALIGCNKNNIDSSLSQSESSSTSNTIAGYDPDAWTYTGDYYSKLDYNSSTFANDLSNLITTTHKKLTSYAGLKTIFITSDADPDKPGNILWFYTGTSVPYDGTMGNGSGYTNREHVFPKSGGSAFPEKTKAGSDAHHLRPAESDLNEKRSDMSFNEIPQITSNIVAEAGKTNYGATSDELCYTDKTFFYPAKGYRGQTARVLFYVVTRWGKEYNLKFVEGAGNNKTIGDLSTLLKWNLEEPIATTEITRNNVVADIQGNRNPFIDNPSFACSIWGSQTEEAKQICSTANVNKIKETRRKNHKGYNPYTLSFEFVKVETSLPIKKKEY